MVFYSFLLPSDSSSKDTNSNSSHVFTSGNTKRDIVPESQFHFDDQDLGNVSGIGDLATFAIPETQMQDRSVNHILRK